MSHDSTPMGTSPLIKCYCLEDGTWIFKTIALNDEYFLQYKKEWNQYKKGELKGKPKKPDDIPAYPSHTYKNKGWQGMADWLGK